MPLGDALQELTLLAVVVGCSLLVGNLFRRIGQPTVLGPITVGLAVGAALAACPEPVRDTVISAQSRAVLDAAGTAGLLLLMFSVGTELRGFGRSGDVPIRWRFLPAVLIPLAIGALAAWPFADRLGPDGAAVGWLFVGIAMSVTAVPVLVSIVRDLGIARRPASRAALRIAIGGDGLAWMLVTVLVVAGTDLRVISIPALVVGVALLVGVTVVAPRVVGRVQRCRRAGAPLLIMVGGALAGAAATQLLGLHPAIGAAVAGFCLPPGFADAPSRRGFGAIVRVLLPAFFVSIAISVPLQALGAQASWAGLACLAVLAVGALTSKLAAGFVFGAMHRWPWRSSAELGVLLNCRGVTEIAIASVGFQAGLITPFAFAALCVLAVVTTVSTAPLYRALAGGDPAGAAPGDRSRTTSVTGRAQQIGASPGTAGSAMGPSGR